jgi:hypothetical protein
VLLVVLVWNGRRTLSRLRSSRGGAYILAGAVALAVALNETWEAIYGPRIPLDLGDLHAGLTAGVREWWRALPDLIGKFGYVDVKLPLIVPLAWLALVLLLASAAVGVCGPRERLAIAMTLVGALLGPVVLYALLLRPTGFGLQGRHLLAALVAVPLLAGETLNRHRNRVDAIRLRLLTRGGPPAVAAMQFLAWYVNAKRYAVGPDGPVWFLDRTTWVPPGGWSPWLIAALLAAACLCAVSTSAAGSTPAATTSSIAAAG